VTVNGLSTRSRRVTDKTATWPMRSRGTARRSRSWPSRSQAGQRACRHKGQLEPESPRTGKPSSTKSTIFSARPMITTDRPNGLGAEFWQLCVLGDNMAASVGRPQVAAHHDASVGLGARPRLSQARETAEEAAHQQRFHSLSRTPPASFPPILNSLKVAASERGQTRPVQASARRDAGAQGGNEANTERRSVVNDRRE
jgi:hypothetical protein